MKLIYTIILILTLGLMHTGCEKIINIDTADGSGKLVIEAIVTNRTGTCKVLLSTTKKFSAPNGFTGVTGAQVSITEVGGTVRDLAETAPGVYEAATFRGTPGRTYQLRVEHNGSVYTAESKMPAQTNIESVALISDVLFGSERNLAQVSFRDPAGIPNYYKFEQYINDRKTKNIFIRSDDYSDGNVIRLTLRHDYEDDEDELKIKTGDSITIRMMCIDSAVYKYWFSLNQSSTGQNQSASPANPVTNIRGGALGYFSAHTLESKSFKVP
ncbi:MAG TPA: DUF4249 domain-containing protein [Parasegetibacter sp.]|jgi:hypothetical protein